MRKNVAALFLAFGLGTSCRGQTTQENKLPPECTKSIKVHGSFPKGPFTFLRGESFKRSPLIKYQINEDGSVSNTKITRSSGVKDFDRKLLGAVSNWKYKSRPAGCGVIETETSVLIHFDRSDDGE
jgi:TonB family protein